CAHRPLGSPPLQVHSSRWSDDGAQPHRGWSSARENRSQTDGAGESGTLSRNPTRACCRENSAPAFRRPAVFAKESSAPPRSREDVARLDESSVRIASRRRGKIWIGAARGGRERAA